jgi:endonuclease YncB( thermonuclease family)
MWTRTALALPFQGIRLSILLFLIVPCAFAQTFVGKVVKVQDGDTLTVLVNKAQIRVRLVDIDAPERKQPFYKRSGQSLAQICAGKVAEVVSNSKDRYNRPLGRVLCVGVDANSEQVRRGMAWVFVRYAPKGSPLYALEREVRGAKRGLWREPGAVAPWEWRASRRSQ